MNNKDVLWICRKRLGRHRFKKDMYPLHPRAFHETSKRRFNLYFALWSINHEQKTPTKHLVNGLSAYTFFNLQPSSGHIFLVMNYWSQTKVQVEFLFSGFEKNLYGDFICISYSSQSFQNQNQKDNQLHWPSLYYSEIDIWLALRTTINWPNIKNDKKLWMRDCAIWEHAKRKKLNPCPYTSHL